MAQTEASVFDRIRFKPPLSETGQHAAPLVEVEATSQTYIPATKAPAVKAGATPVADGKASIEAMPNYSKYTKPSAKAETAPMVDMGTEAMPDYNKYSKQATTIVTPMGTEVADTTVPTKPLTVTDLYKDKDAQKTMREYFRYTLGESVDSMSNESVADKYVNRMRMWNAGNSFTVVNELYTLTMGTEEHKSAALKAFDLWDNTASMFSKDATWGDTFDGLFDYAWATIADPTNVAAMAGGAGIAARIGTKSAAVSAQVAAKAAAKMAIDKAISTGVKDVAARKIGEKIFDDTLRKAMASSVVKSAIKKEALKKGVATLGVDTALTLGVDYAYQQGLIISGKQKDYSPLQGGIVALGVLGGNMVSYAASQGAKLASKALATKAVETTVVNGVPTNVTKDFVGQDVGMAIRASKETAVSTPKAAATAAAEKISVNLDFALKTLLSKPLKETMSWSDKVAKGTTKLAIDETVDMGTDPDFFKYLVFGNKEMGVTGIAESLLSSGVIIPQKKAADDGITDFVTDVFLNLPDEYAEKMAASFRATLGKKSPEYNIKTGKDLSTFMAAKVSASGRNMNIMSHWRKLNNSYTAELTTKSMLDGMVAKAPVVMDTAWKKMGFVHNVFLRVVTSHPATTLMNAKGHLAVMAMDDFSDIIRTTLHYGLGFIWDSHKEQAKAISKNLKFRFTTYLDPKTTVQAFNSWATEHSDIQDKLSRYMLTGVDYVGTDEAFKKQFGFSLSDSPILSKMDKYANAAQVVYGAKAVDNVTKAMSFIPNLDKQLRLKFGSDVGFLKFYSQEGSDLFKKMRTQDYLDVVGMAYEDTGRELMSLPAEKGTMGAVLETISRTPFVGTLFPFGRFFNGTVRVMSDFTGTGALGRVVGIAANGAGKALGKGDVYNLDNRSTTELVSRGILGFTAIATLAQQYEVNLIAGLSYNEEFDTQGNILNREYEYPENFLRYAGALLYYAMSDKEMPAELSLGNEGWKKFGLGNLTRSISDEERGILGSVDAILSELTSEEGEPFKQVVKTSYDALFVNYVTALTRPLDPINHAAAMYRGDEYSAPDRKQGYEWLNNSMRYTDQIFTVLSEVATGKPLDIAPPKHVATRESIPLSPLQIISERIIPPRSYTEKMFKKIGKAIYETNTKSYVPEASDALNKNIVPFIEARMKLLDNSAFDAMPLDKQKYQVNNALSLAKDDALEAMRSSLIVEDARMAALFDISKKLSKPAVQKVLNMFREDIGEGDLYDLDLYQLEILTQRIKLEEERIKAP